ncbi:MAG TPA: bifunctional serine/threonine-protein kinase/formylglycine-generating enzyme family protein [Verrucomicrobiales bacterium]|nr:bifunctional serine/threonine-protein kinase/formylglycine-generating enzyme family protein [Verrucomicrobiales bacterium]
MQNSSSNLRTPTIRSEAPRIPDHDLLRCIGRGSYGEVWLARSLTGSLRAIKIVRREDFELDRTFEREFEGIMRFEPISRDHPGLVHILHVGRNDEEGFYYYVMELGDDRETGSRVDPGDYEARTMGTDRTMKKRLPVQDCVQHGIVLADALAHLHEHGLTHRDIKPSNIIFVNGKPKLADIGLVAAEGQMTFVGTEGFVPPEGPGTASADIYSLGMVLYELSTGNDRLQFPELPNEPGNPAHRPMRRALNDVVCKACAPIPKKRFATARLMAEALRAAWRAKNGQRNWVRRLVTLPILSGIIAFALVTWRHGGAMPWPPGKFRGAPAGFLLTGSVTLESDPVGVDVIFDGHQLGRTPITVDKIPAGSAIFTLRKNRYRDATVSVSGVSPGGTVKAEHTVMEFYDPPRIGAPWENSLGMPFEPRQTDHISRNPVSLGQFREIVPDVMYADVVTESNAEGQLIPMVRVPFKIAVRFCDRLAARDLKEGYFPPEGYCYRAQVYQAKAGPDSDPEQKDFVCFRIIAEKMGSLSIDSNPQEAAIFDGETRLEVTPFVMPVHRTGPITLVLKKEGYKDKKVEGVVKAGEPLAINVDLERSLMPMPRADWQNSLGMQFKPVEDLRFSIWETRVQDYAGFATETKRNPGIVDADKNGQSDIGQMPAHPAVNLTRADANAFCQWLTAKERKESYLPPSLEYRLPTDAEWTLAAGIINDEALSSPAARQNRLAGLYPWDPDDQYPPPGSEPFFGSEEPKPPVANLGDLTALAAKTLSSLTEVQIAEMKAKGYKYKDGFAYAAPVGQFPTSEKFHNLYDLSGNVWEIVSDDYGDNPLKPDPSKAKFVVCRGASWAEPVTQDKQWFYTHFRRAVPPGQEADAKTGFRVVLAPVKTAQ